MRISTGTPGRPWHGLGGRVALTGLFLALFVTIGGTSTRAQKGDLLPPPPPPGGSSTTVDEGGVEVKGRWECGTPLLYGPQPQWQRFRSTGNLTSGRRVGSLLWTGSDGGGVIRWDLISGRYQVFIPPGSVKRRRIIALDVTADSTLWVGTRGAGLGKFDGLRWKFFGRKAGLRDLNVQAVAISKDGSVWVGTPKGVARFDKGRFKNYGRKSGLPDKDIRSMAFDEKGRLVVGTFLAGPAYFDGRRFRPLPTKKRFPAVGVGCVVPDGKGKIWFCTDQGAIVYDGVTFRSYSVEHGMVSPLVRTVGISREGGVWFGTRSRGMSRLEKGQWRNFNRGAMATAIAFIIRGRGDEMLIGTRRVGVWRYRGKKGWSPLSVGIAGNRVQEFTFDHSGGVWFGTSTGVSMVRGGRWVHWAGKPLPNTNVTGLAPEPGQVWVATNGGAAARYNGSSWRIYEKLDGVVGHDLISASVSPGGVWFAGRTSGVCHFGLKGWKSYTHKSTKGVLPSSSVVLNRIFADTLMRVWVATRGRGVAMFDGSRWRKFRANARLPHREINDVTEDDYRRIWFATRGGLAVWDGSKMVVFNKKNGLPSDEVRSVAAWGDTIWVATDKGVACGMPSGWVRVTKKHGLPSEDMSVVRIGPWGDKWFGTRNDGAAVFRGTCADLMPRKRRRRRR